MNIVEPNETNRPADQKTWILVFIFCFLGLLADGADLMLLSYSLSSFKQEFGLTNTEAGMLGSVTLAGMAFGGIVGGWAADRFGRVRAIVWTTVIFSVGTALLGTTHTFSEFAAIRFIAALGLGAEYVICNTLMAEYVPTERRTTVLGTLQAGWSVGYVVATLLAGWILPTYGWRPMFYTAIFPVVLAVLMHRLVPEPSSWLASRSQQNTGGQDTEGHEKHEVDQRNGAIAQIFGDAAVRRMFMLWALAAGLLQFGYYGVNNWMPTYLEKELGMNFKTMTMYMVGTYTAMIVGKIIAGWMADKLGRRTVFAIGALGSAVFLPIIVLFNSPENIVYLMTIFGFLYGMPYGVNATYMAESFATQVRGTAVGGAYNVGRVGAAIAPAAIGYLASSGSIGIGFLVMGAAYFFCGLVPLLFIKEKIYDPQK